MTAHSGSSSPPASEPNKVSLCPFLTESISRSMLVKRRNSLSGRQLVDLQVVLYVRLVPLLFRTDTITSII
mgnify:CR=1 FL=1